MIAGEDAFELYDTFGFPIDLTRLLAGEKGLTIDEKGFEKALARQKQRSKAAASRAVGDWVQVHPGEDVEFVGYDQLSVKGARVIKYRTVAYQKKEQYQVVLNRTPFYGESGGQAGDTGWLYFGGDKVKVVDTKKENELTVHLVDRLPEDMETPVDAYVDQGKRQSVSSNHSATHLMHAALHKVLGEHALQKGQDVDPNRLRFDFSHFQKVSDEELSRIEQLVNEKIRENIALEEQRNLPIEEAKASGAMMLFGEKYGDLVRVITFDRNFSRELCGGTHVPATGEIGLFKIIGESSVAAGIRRLEAVTGMQAMAYIDSELNELQEIRQLFKNSPNTVKMAEALQEENKQLKKEIERLLAAQANSLRDELLRQAETIDGITFIAARLPLSDTNAVKNLAYQLEGELEKAVIVFGLEKDGKAQLMIAISKELTESKGLHAGNMIRELAREISGGGGGQPFFATAGGKDPGGLDKAIARGRDFL